jgi:hypothetical protein
MNKTPTTDNLLQAALEYAAGGRPVFPLVPGKKAPLTARGFKDATLDPDQIRRWWALDEGVPMSRDTQPGIGLPTGVGLVVIDVDVDKGGEIDLNWPPTLTATTRSNGWHLYYEVDREVPNSVGRLGKGVDVRGDGGYVVAPPTPGWRFVNADKYPVKPIDVMLLVPARGPGSALEDDWEPFRQAEDASVGEGQRNDYVARFVGWLIRLGLDTDDELMEATERENERACAPPLEWSEVRQVVSSIGRYR